MSHLTPGRSALDKLSITGSRKTLNTGWCRKVNSGTISTQIRTMDKKDALSSSVGKPLFGHNKSTHQKSFNVYINNGAVLAQSI